MNHCDAHQTDFPNNSCLGFLLKYFRTLCFWLKSTKMHITLDKYLLHIYVIGVSTGATVSPCLMIEAQEM